MIVIPSRNDSLRLLLLLLCEAPKIIHTVRFYFNYDFLINFVHQLNPERMSQGMRGVTGSHSWPWRNHMLSFWLTCILSNLNNFHSLEVVDRVSETQLQMSENSD